MCVKQDDVRIEIKQLVKSGIHRSSIDLQLYTFTVLESYTSIRFGMRVKGLCLVASSTLSHLAHFLNPSYILTVRILCSR